MKIAIIITWIFSISLAIADISMLFTIYYDWIINKQPLFNGVFTIIAGITMVLILSMCYSLFMWGISNWRCRF